MEKIITCTLREHDPESDLIGEHLKTSAVLKQCRKFIGRCYLHFDGIFLTIMLDLIFDYSDKILVS